MDIKPSALIICMVVFSPAVSAMNFCSKPYKPFKFSSEWQYKNFMEEVESFKECINDFVEEQNRVAKRAAEAAEEAIEEWNDFVRYELD